MLERRLQILLDQERFDRLTAEAGRRGSSVAAVIRDAIDLALPDGRAGRSAAATALLAAPDMAVPDVAMLRAELEEIRGRHA